jgi:YkoY family integral membrane protein
MTEPFLSFLATVSTLAVLETLLSVDNAVVLALMARELPEAQQKRALRYGLVGALVLRIVAVFAAARLTEYVWVRAIGGAYLLWLAIRYFAKFSGGGKKPVRASAGFWTVVFWIEVTDLVFAVDSILAAVALTRDSWAIITGSMIGVIAIRFAAEKTIGLLKRFPRLEMLAYLLVAGVGLKVLFEISRHSF